MRRQFKTSGPEENRIGDYQVVRQRVAQAFATLVIYSCSLKKEVSATLLAKSVLKQVMKLRECCGGWGYLRVSGMPTLV
jgi:hypothetical protein